MPIDAARIAVTTITEQGGEAALLWLTRRRTAAASLVIWPGAPEVLARSAWAVGVSRGEGVRLMNERSASELLPPGALVLMIGADPDAVLVLAGLSEVVALCVAVPAEAWGTWEPPAGSTVLWTPLEDRALEEEGASVAA